MLTDEQLVSEYQDGKEAAFDELIHRYTQSFFYFALQIVKNKAEAEDAVQDSFIKIWKSLNTFDESKKLKTWMYRIVKNTCLDHLRKNKKEIIFTNFDKEGDGESAGFADYIPDEGLSPLEIVIEKQEAEELYYLIKQLPEIYQIILRLYYLEEMTLAEIADILEESLDTIKSRHRRALIKLRMLVGGAIGSLKV